MNKIEIKTSEQAKEEIKNAVKSLGGFVTDLIDEVLKLEEKNTQLQQELDGYKLICEGDFTKGLRVITGQRTQECMIIGGIELEQFFEQYAYDEKDYEVYIKEKEEQE